MARHGFWSRLVVCGATAALLLTPAFATEETVKEEKPAPEAKKATEGTAKPDAAKQDAAECKPTSRRSLLRMSATGER